MAKNYIQPGDSLAYTNSGGATITSGSAIVMGARLGIALVDIAPAGTGTVAARGVFTLPKLGTDNVTQGALLYWDAGNSHLTTTAGSNVLAGYAAAPAGVGVATVALALNA